MSRNLPISNRISVDVQQLFEDLIVVKCNVNNKEFQGILLNTSKSFFGINESRLKSGPENWAVTDGAEKPNISYSCSAERYSYKIDGSGPAILTRHPVKRHKSPPVSGKHVICHKCQSVVTIPAAEADDSSRRGSESESGGPDAGLDALAAASSRLTPSRRKSGLHPRRNSNFDTRENFESTLFPPRPESGSTFPGAGEAPARPSSPNPVRKMLKKKKKKEKEKVKETLAPPIVPLSPLKISSKSREEMKKKLKKRKLESNIEKIPNKKSKLFDSEDKALQAISSHAVVPGKILKSCLKRHEEPDMKAKELDPKVKEPDVKVKETETKAKEREPKIKDKESKGKHTEHKGKEREVKPKASILKVKETVIKSKEPVLKVKETELKVKESVLKTKEAASKVKEPELKAVDSGLKLKDPETKLKETYLKVKDPDLHLNETDLDAGAPSHSAEVDPAARGMDKGMKKLKKRIEMEKKLKKEKKALQKELLSLKEGESSSNSSLQLNGSSERPRRLREKAAEAKEASSEVPAASEAAKKDKESSEPNLNEARLRRRTDVPREAAPSSECEVSSVGAPAWVSESPQRKSQDLPPDSSLSLKIKINRTPSADNGGYQCRILNEESHPAVSSSTSDPPLPAAADPPEPKPEREPQEESEPIVVQVNRCTLPRGASFAVGDVVWAKITGYPWWPSRITVIQASERTEAGTKVTSYTAEVLWFNWDQISFIPCEKLFHFLEHYNARCDKKRKGTYRNAVEQAWMAAQAAQSAADDDEEEEEDVRFDSYGQCLSRPSSSGLQASPVSSSSASAPGGPPSALPASQDPPGQALVTSSLARPRSAPEDTPAQLDMSDEDSESGLVIDTDQVGQG